MSTTSKVVRGASTLADSGTRSLHVASPREDLVTVVLSACFVGGALTDAWAHSNIVKQLESFFTPWHAMLYGGFTATAAWTFWMGFRRRHGVQHWWRNAWPAGYAVGALGAAIFLIAGVGDMLWHTIFGIESTLDAALSPTHLLLAFGGTLLLTSPLRSWWANGSGGDRAATGIASLALGTTLAILLVSFASGLTSTAPTRVYDQLLDSPSHVDAAFGIGRYLITTVVLGVPLLLAHRRRATFGTGTAIVGAVALFEVVQYELREPMTIAAAGAVLGAAVADLVLVRLDALRGPDARLRLPIAGAVFATLIWTGHLIGLRLADDLRWQVELWTGAVVLSAVLGAVLGGLAAGPASRVTLART
jgi:hypothetical protein